ncbi:MAG: F0F1 ATP synthase subunit delta [Rhodoglobus sp.]
MGSASREALARSRSALNSVVTGDSLAVGKQLCEAARVIGGSPQLLSMLADSSTDVADKATVIDRVFSSFGMPVRTLLTKIVEPRWSSHGDLLAGLEEIAIRAIAKSTPLHTSIESELFAFGAAVSSNAELELAVGSKLGTAVAKSALVTTLLKNKSSEQTLAIVDHLVQQPRGRRSGELIRTAASIVADEAGYAIATVISAVPMNEVQAERLRLSLVRNVGRDLRLNVVVDPSIVGGIRVHIGDDVIDGSISTRINELRLTLAS